MNIKKFLLPSLKILWVFVCMSLLISFVFEMIVVMPQGKGPEHEIGEFVGFYLWFVAMLSFPLGTVFWFILQGLLWELVVYFLNLEISSFFYTLNGIVTSTGCFIVGYFQWFRLVPWLYNRIALYIKSRNIKKATEVIET